MVTEREIDLLCARFCEMRDELIARRELERAELALASENEKREHGNVATGTKQPFRLRCTTCLGKSEIRRVHPDGWSVVEPCPSCTDLSDATDINETEREELNGRIYECALTWAPEARLIGNVSAAEIMRFCDDHASMRAELTRLRNIVAKLGDAEMVLPVEWVANGIYADLKAADETHIAGTFNRPNYKTVREAQLGVIHLRDGGVE